MPAILLAVLITQGCAQLPDAINPTTWFRGLDGSSGQAQIQTPATTAAVEPAATHRIPSRAQQPTDAPEVGVAAKAPADAVPPSPFDVARLFEKLFSASGPRNKGAVPNTSVAYTPPTPDPDLKLDAPESPATSAQVLLQTGPAAGQEATAVDAASRSREAVMVHFAVGSAAVSPSDRKKLRRIAKLFREHGGTVRVVGHASSRTRNLPIERHKMINFGISLDRATRVANELIKMGVEPEAIVTIANSDNDPLYYEWMPSGEAGNRRAEITIVY